MVAGGGRIFLSHEQDLILQPLHRVRVVISSHQNCELRPWRHTSTTSFFECPLGVYCTAPPAWRTTILYSSSSVCIVCPQRQHARANSPAAFPWPRPVPLAFAVRSTSRRSCSMSMFDCSPCVPASSCICNTTTASYRRASFTALSCTLA